MPSTTGWSAYVVTLHGLPLIKRPVWLLTYTPKKFGAASGFRPRDLLDGDEASYSLDYGRECFIWLPGQESNLQHAFSRKALRSDTECLAELR